MNAEETPIRVEEKIAAPVTVKKAVGAAALAVDARVPPVEVGEKMVAPVTRPEGW